MLNILKDKFDLCKELEKETIYMYDRIMSIDVNDDFDKTIELIKDRKFIMNRISMLQGRVAQAIESGTYTLEGEALNMSLACNELILSSKRVDDKARAYMQKTMQELSAKLSQNSDVKKVITGYTMDSGIEKDEAYYFDFAK